MKSICLFFHVHQPYRLRKYRFFDIGEDHYYYDNFLNRSTLKRVSENAYLPSNALLLELIEKHSDDFKVSFSISGAAMEQFAEYAPEVLESFKKLAATGNVEFVAQTYSHSLASLKDRKEFEYQVKKHAGLLEHHFGKKPVSFINTEMVYMDETGKWLGEMGFENILTEGARHVLGWKSPNYLYHHPEDKSLNILLRNYRLSDDVAFRFSDKSWQEWPLTTERYVDWLNQTDPKEPLINIFMDYETFGEHQGRESGIFDFLKALPEKVLETSNYRFSTPELIGKSFTPVSPVYVPFAISWADEERDLTAWLGNDLQKEAFDNLYSNIEKIRDCDDIELLSDWNRLQNSDHFYYMSTKWFSAGEVQRYYNPYDTPYDAFVNYMNVLSDFNIRAEKCLSQPTKLAVSEPEKKAIVKKPARLTGKKKPSAKSKSTFEDVARLPKTKLKKLIRETEVKDWIRALHNAESNIQDRVLDSFTKTKKTQFSELSQQSGDISKTEVTKSRTRILKKMNALFAY